MSVAIHRFALPVYTSTVSLMSLGVLKYALKIFFSRKRDTTTIDKHIAEQTFAYRNLYKHKNNNWKGLTLDTPCAKLYNFVSPLKVGEIWKFLGHVMTFSLSMGR